MFGGKTRRRRRRKGESKRTTGKDRCKEAEDTKDRRAESRKL